MRFEEFVVGVDGSAPSRAAIRWAIEWSQGEGATVTLVHVLDDGWGLVSPRVIGEAEAHAQALLAGELAFARDAALARDGAPTVVVRGGIRTGSPMWELSRHSSPRSVVVVGTHKTGFHRGRATGSRSLQLANEVAGAMAVIPEESARARQGIIAGVDHTPAGHAAIDLAADLAQREGLDLTLVRATEGRLGDADGRTWEEDPDRRLLAAAAERVRQRHPRLEVRRTCVIGPAGLVLTDAARSARLLIIGDSRRTDMTPGSLGSVAYDVLLNPSGPTLVVHAADSPMHAQDSSTHAPDTTTGL